MSNEEDIVIHTEGELYDMICDHICPLHYRRDQIMEMSAITNEKDENWVIVYTNWGKSLLIETHDLRKWNLERLINKIKTT